MAHPTKKICASARVHVSKNLGFSVYVRKYHIRTYISSLSAGYQDTYMYLRIMCVCMCVFCTWHQPAPMIRVCRYVPGMYQGYKGHKGSAFIVHKPNRTATSTCTVHRRQNKPYRLGAASAGVVGTRSRCCPAATVRALSLIHI